MISRQLSLFCLFLLMASPGAVHAISPQRVYIANDDHTDYLWTADEAAYEQAFIDMIDYYLDLADSTVANPTIHQSRWNCDGSYWLWTYEQNKSATEFARLINRIKSGHISAPLTALVSCYGGCPVEAVIRGMYYAGRIERQHDLRFNMAVAMENQTLPYGLGALWSGSGARYSWRGICDCATQVSSAWDREHDIYWWNGPDGSRILMKWNSMLTTNRSLGGYAEARDPAAAVDYVTVNAASNGFLARYPYDIIGVFGNGWDDLATFSSSFVTTAIGMTNAARTVIVSNEEDFFSDFESAYGAGLPSESRSYGNEWDLYCASMAEVSAKVKRATERLRNAEALATLVCLKDEGFMNGRDAARDLAWMNLGIYWEHDWTANGPVPQAVRRDWQRRIAGEIQSYVDALQSDAIAALGGLIGRTGGNTRFFAFNSLSWTRTDYADIAYTGALPVHVVDVSTGLETPSQIVMIGGEPRLRILAANVPPVGYRVYEIAAGAGTGYPDAATVLGNQIENATYRLTVANRGAITSLIDKSRANREFVRNIGGRFMNDLGASTGALSVENAGPVSVTLFASAASPLDHHTRITLFRDIDRIEIRNEIRQNFGSIQTWAFGFELNSPDIRHEEVGAVVRAKLTTAGGHYSPRNARYDWLTLNHFADITGGGVGMTLSNADCSFMKIGASTASALDTATPQISPLAGGQVDGAGLGIVNQGGDTFFLQRFALQSHDSYNQAAAMRFALEHQNPLATGIIAGGSAYPAGKYSLIDITDPGVFLWSIKPAEDGVQKGYMVRLWNQTASPVNCLVSTTAGPITSATRTTHIETPLAAANVMGGDLAASLSGNELRTYNIRISSGSTNVKDWNNSR